MMTEPMATDLWPILFGKPVRFPLNVSDAEKSLLDRIAGNPALLRSRLLIVGRQMPLDAGALDLLGIDATGRWVAIDVNGDLPRRERVLRALDYAANIATMPVVQLAGMVNEYLEQHGSSLDNFFEQHHWDGTIFDRREVDAYIVETARSENLDETIAAMLRGRSITLVNLENSTDETGAPVLIRRLATLPDPLPPDLDFSPYNNQKVKIDGLFKLAYANGIGHSFRLVYEVAIKHGLYPRAYRWSIMYTPPEHRGRCLLCVWVKPKCGWLDIVISTPTFAEFYPIDGHTARQILGKSRRTMFTPFDAEAFVHDFERLFAVIAGNR